MAVINQWHGEALLSSHLLAFDRLFAGISHLRMRLAHTPQSDNALCDSWLRQNVCAGEFNPPRMLHIEFFHSLSLLHWHPNQFGLRFDQPSIDAWGFLASSLLFSRNTRASLDQCHHGYPDRGLLCSRFQLSDLDGRRPEETNQVQQVSLDLYLFWILYPGLRRDSPDGCAEPLVATFRARFGHSDLL